MSRHWDIPIFITIMITVVGILLYSIGFIFEHATLPATVAKIEQVRHAVQRISRNESEDIMGQAVSLNKLIAEKQAYNNIWWSAPVIPNRWNSIKFIEIPTR